MARLILGLWSKSSAGAGAAGALMTGLVGRAGRRPETATRTIRLTAYGSREQAEWTWPAFHLTGVVLAYLEPDPQVIWDDGRYAAAGAILDEMLQFGT